MRTGGGIDIKWTLEKRVLAHFGIRISRTTQQGAFDMDFSDWPNRSASFMKLLSTIHFVTDVNGDMVIGDLALGSGREIATFNVAKQSDGH